MPPRALAATPSQVPPAPDAVKCDQAPGANRNAPTPTPSTSSSFAIVTPSAVRPPVLTDRQLIAATIQIVAKAVKVNPLNDHGWPNTGMPTCQDCNAPPSATFMKIANPTASAACAPACATTKPIQP